MELYLRHTRRIGAGLRIILHMAVFQRKDAGHDFGSACHGENLFSLLFIEDASGICIHQNRGLGIQFQGIVGGSICLSA